MMKFNPVWRPKTEEKKSFRAEILKPKLEGFRVLVTPPDYDDYDKWARTRLKNQKFLVPYEPKWPENCLSEDFFIRRLQKQEKNRKAGTGAYFLIHHKAGGDIIGGINLNDIKLGAVRHATLGYWLAQEYQGQGYMREAARLVIDFAFQVIKLKRLNAASLPDNDRSIKLLLALGFEEEGYAKKYLQINGQWRDHRLFGLVRPPRI
jgi:ribosomal-protein-alanine N-acetyltransferase